MKHGDVLRVQFPNRGGREQAGTRPAILMQSDDGPKVCPTLVVVPLTSQLAAARFAHTVRVQPTPGTGLSVESVALVFQITAIDRANVVEQLGAVAEEALDRVLAAIIAMISPVAESSD